MLCCRGFAVGLCLTRYPLFGTLCKKINHMRTALITNAQTIRIDILPRCSDIGVSGDKGRDNGALRRTLLNVEDYRFLFENAYDATLLTHEDGRIIVANARAEWLLRCSENGSSGR